MRYRLWSATEPSGLALPPVDQGRKANANRRIFCFSDRFGEALSDWLSSSKELNPRTRVDRRLSKRGSDEGLVRPYRHSELRPMHARSYRPKVWQCLSRSNV